VPPYI